MTNKLNKYENVEWDLNLLFQYDALWPAICKTIKRFSLPIPKVNLYGTMSNIWAGGQIPGVYGEFKQETLRNLFNYLKEFDTTPTLNFASSSITKEDLKDKYANFILETAFEYNSRFIVFSEILRDYIKEKNPNATVISPAIKASFRFQGPDKIEEPTIENETNFYNKLLKEYDIVVVRPEYSKNILPYHHEYIDDISRLEILINQPCMQNCPKMPDHYRYLEKLNVNPDQNLQFRCVRIDMPYIILYQNNLMHDEETIKKLIQNGIKHIAIMSKQNSAFNSILYETFQLMFDTTGSNHLIIAECITERLLEEIHIFNDKIGNTEGLFSIFS